MAGIDQEALDGVVKKMEEEAKARKACGKKRHPGEEVLSISQYRGPPQARCYCHDCGARYKRNLKGEEGRKWRDKLNRPMDF